MHVIKEQKETPHAHLLSEEGYSYMRTSSNSGQLALLMGDRATEESTCSHLSTGRHAVCTLTTVINNQQQCAP